MSKTKIALVVGHSEKSRGAYNEEMNVHEYYLNEALAKDTRDAMNLDPNLEAVLVYRKNGYNKLPSDIDKVKADIIICFHHNSTSNRTVQGTETLYYHRSVKSKAIAAEVQKQLVNVLEFRDRGIKGVDSEDRGAYVLKYTKAPCILIEPYFISETEGMIIAMNKRFDCAIGIRDGINKYLR